MLDKKKVQNKRFNKRENNGVGRGVGWGGEGTQGVRNYAFWGWGWGCLD